MDCSSYVDLQYGENYHDISVVSCLLILLDCFLVESEEFVVSLGPPRFQLGLLRAPSGTKL